MAKKSDLEQAENKQEQKNQAPAPVEKKEVKLKQFIKKSQRAMYNECVIKLKAGQKITDSFLRHTLESQGVELVSDLSECDF